MGVSSGYLEQPARRLLLVALLAEMLLQLGFRLEGSYDPSQPKTEQKRKTLGFV